MGAAGSFARVAGLGLFWIALTPGLRREASVFRPLKRAGGGLPSGRKYPPALMEIIGAHRFRIHFLDACPFMRAFSRALVLISRIFAGTIPRYGIEDLILFEFSPGLNFS